ncbi:hypothetical protein L1887_14869 [Cichorium endivia]|nr:hypothetical protein L1887_14869 [Cichorium endivia]
MILTVFFRNLQRKDPSIGSYGGLKRKLRSPVEMSCVSVESMLPFHTATASALLTSMLSAAPRTYGWTLEENIDQVDISYLGYRSMIDDAVVILRGGGGFKVLIHKRNPSGAVREGLVLETKKSSKKGGGKGAEGIGLNEILNAIVQRIPPPLDSTKKPLRALIFDSIIWTVLELRGQKLEKSLLEIAQRDYSPTFNQPASYLRARGARAEIGDFVEYDLHNDDEDWLQDFNKERLILPAEKAGVITSTLGSLIPVLLTFDAAVEALQALSIQYGVFQSIYSYRKEKRERWLKPVLHRLQTKGKSSQTSHKKDAKKRKQRPII